MSDESKGGGRDWFLFLAAVVAAFVGILAIGYLAGGDEGEHVDAEESHEEGEPQGIAQAPWKIRTFAAGKSGKLTTTQQDQQTTHGKTAAETIERVYDALLIDGAGFDEVLERHFTRGSAAALRKERPLPGSAEEVKTLVRKASIGIRADGARMAAAKVYVTFKASNEGRRMRLVHKADLWLERGATGWSVVAFDYSQRPSGPSRPAGKKD